MRITHKGSLMLNVKNGCGCRLSLPSILHVHFLCVCVNVNIKHAWKLVRLDGSHEIDIHFLPWREDTRCILQITWGCVCELMILSDES